MISGPEKCSSVTKGTLDGGQSVHVVTKAADRQVRACSTARHWTEMPALVSASTPWLATKHMGQLKSPYTTRVRVASTEAGI